MLILVAGAALFLAGCGGTGGTVTPPNQAVAITVQPLSQTVPIGQTATFSVTATGTAPLSYQWSENGAEIPAATASSYTTPAVALDAGGSTPVGSFQVTVSNAVGSVTSNAATLTAGPRSPKAGDLRYLLWQQVDVPGLMANPGGGIVQALSIDGGEGGAFSDSWMTNGVGSPLAIGGQVCGVSSNTSICGWGYVGEFLPPPMTGLSMYYEAGSYSTYLAGLESYAASNVVFTSLDLEPATGFYAVAYVQTTQPGGFDSRQDPLVPPGANQPALIQAQATLDGTESRVITAVSFDASGNAVLFSYGWTGDTTTVYETQTTVVPATEVVAAATTLAGQGYILSAFGGNDADGYILIGMRVVGDSLPRPIALGTTQSPYNTAPPYDTPVLYLFEDGNPIVFEQ